MVMYLGDQNKRSRQALASRLPLADWGVNGLFTSDRYRYRGGGLNGPPGEAYKKSETNGPLPSQVAATVDAPQTTIGALVLKNGGSRFWKFLSTEIQILQPLAGIMGSLFPASI